MLGGNVEFLADQDLKKRGYSPEDTPEEYEKLWGPTLEKIKSQVKNEHEEVVKLGGLYVLGTERHESRRIDNQLRGRSGRQGDPGESRFYLSLEDDLMRLFNTQLVARVMRQGLPEGQPIESKSVSKGVRNAQKAVESRNYEIRKNVLKYDDVMNKQRTVIYAERQKVLMGENIHQTVMDFLKNTINAYAKAALPSNIKPSDWDVNALWQAYAQLYPISLSADDEKKKATALKKHEKAIASIEKDVLADAKAQYDAREKQMGEDFVKDLECRVVLAVLDRKWREHLYEMDYLKDGIGLRGMGQRDPLVEYQREGYRMYNSMVEAIEEESVQLLFHLDLQQIKHEEEQAREQAESGTELSGPTEPSQENEDLDEDETAADRSGADEQDESQESPASSTAGEQMASQPIIGVQPLTHEDREISVSTRIRNGQAAELRVPWADGRTFPGTPKNAPCPCGSGRKYKMCHGQNEVHQAAHQK